MPRVTFLVSRPHATCVRIALANGSAEWTPENIADADAVACALLKTSFLKVWRSGRTAAARCYVADRSRDGSGK